MSKLILTPKQLEVYKFALENDGVDPGTDYEKLGFKKANEVYKYLNPLLFGGYMKEVKPFKAVKKQLT